MLFLILLVLHSSTWRPLDKGSHIGGVQFQPASGDLVIFNKYWCLSSSRDFRKFRNFFSSIPLPHLHFWRSGTLQMTSAPSLEISDPSLDVPRLLLGARRSSGVSLEPFHPKEGRFISDFSGRQWTFKGYEKGDNRRTEDRRIYKRSSLVPPCRCLYKQCMNMEVLTAEQEFLKPRAHFRKFVSGIH